MDCNSNFKKFSKTKLQFERDGSLHADIDVLQFMPVQPCVRVGLRIERFINFPERNHDFGPLSAKNLSHSLDRADDRLRMGAAAVLRSRVLGRGARDSVRALLLV